MTAQIVPLEFYRAIRDGKVVQPEKGFWHSLRSAFVSEEQAIDCARTRQNAIIDLWEADSLSSGLGPDYVIDTYERKLAVVKRMKEFG